MDLKELYRDVILDHNRHPRNFGRIEAADSRADGHNPLCGDRLSVFVVLDGERVADIRFEGRGCAISDRKSTRLNSSHGYISYAVFCLKKKKDINQLMHVLH